MSTDETATKRTTFSFWRYIRVDGVKVKVKNQNFHKLHGCDNTRLGKKHVLGYKCGKLVYKQPYRVADPYQWLDKNVK